MLYHSLSRASSLGDDDRFTDVRDMVNVRFMAIKHSLPDVPNFKMPSIPSLAKLQAVSRRSTISLNGIFFNESANHSKQNLEREIPSAPKDTPIDDSERLDRVLEELTGDLVIMGGYRGSILRSAEPPHQQLWAPVKLGLNMRKANLEVGLDDEDEETMEERIIPSGMLQHIGPIDISRKFFKKLRSCENARTGRLRVWDYGYDWRLSPSRSSKRLLEFLRNLPSNQPGVPAESRGAIVIAHSLGGLITRHVVNLQPDLFAGVLYCGTPMRAVNILGPMRNGDAVLFNDKLLTAQVNFSIRTSFALLPEDGFLFIDKYTGEEYPVDFYNPDSWVKFCLSPCVAPALPPYNRQAPHSPLAAFFPNALLRQTRGDGKSDRRRNSLSGPDAVASKEQSAIVNNIQGRASMAPQLGRNQIHRHTLSIPPSQAPFSSNNLPPSPPSPIMDPEPFRRNYEYLTRTLASIKQFRSELAHNPAHQEANAYPPLAVIYGKSIPTVYAARVNGRDSIPCSDAYDELVFRPGDGVVLAKESMLPEGYSIAKGGRVRTERGHVSMMGDMPALGKALGALLRGRRKGIGYGAVPPATA
jgi:pimeloyl-ACP methyl ester carboxylesterase